MLRSLRGCSPMVLRSSRKKLYSALLRMRGTRPVASRAAGWSSTDTAASSAATVAALLTACGPDVAPAVPPEELTGAAWSLTDASGSTPVAGFPVTLRFDDDGSLHGSGGCNRLAGRFAVDGALLTIEDNLATTRRSCPEAVMTLEHNAAPTGGATRAPPGSAPPRKSVDQYYVA